ncbi:MAG: PilW family protein [Candidatus Binatia bacterium]
MTRNATHGLGSAGFTIHEVLIATTLGLLVMGGFLSAYSFQLFSMQDQVNQLHVQTTARSIVDLFAREVRRAGTNPTCAQNIAGIALATATQLRIQSDFNESGDIDAPNEDVTYRYDPAAHTIERVSGGVPETLATNIDPSGSVIRYFDDAGQELKPDPALTASQRAAVRRVRIELNLSAHATNPHHSVASRAQVSTDVDVRNRYFAGQVSCGAQNGG